ncbi:serine/threonine protein kinase [Stackebrandtia albiflava]|uniref:non-specific serine/threonine protein kinase n=1 Tax=Stackebrandtia albiflava TaxID=406432 RepID=A0A562V4P2_9ACTN|nr:hypothetical protein [Stackebrandtia albiflava]TWJ12788.1 serine/threonine protein kinase [Stackebrandtia albiflava]
MRAVATAGAVRLVRLLHQDSTASVYSGTVVDSSAPVVVTVAERRADGAGRGVFLDWASRLAKLSTHPHIAPLASAGLTETGRPYMAVHTTRRTFADLLAETGPRPAGQVRALGVALADALSGIHSAGLIHGALQPATVLAGANGRLIVAGFDTTAPSLAHCLPVTGYTSPEHLEACQAGSVHGSPAADVYDLATLLYGALGGRPPWLTGPRDASEPMLRSAPLPDIPGVSTSLTDVLGDGMNPNPRLRPDAATLGRRLAEIDLTGHVKPGTRPHRVAPGLLPRGGPRPVSLPGGADVAVTVTPRRRRRLRVPRPVKVAAATVLAFAAVGGAGFLTFTATDASAEPRCPSEAELTEAVRDTIARAVVTDRLCGEDGYVAVTADVASEEDTRRMVLRQADGRWRIVSGCETDVPAELREYLACGR